MSQNTHVNYVQTDSVSDVSLLLDLDGFAVDWIESDAFDDPVAVSRVILSGLSAATDKGDELVMQIRLGRADGCRW